MSCNSLSSVARDMMQSGLLRCSVDVGKATELYQLVSEMFQVPECPSGFYARSYEPKKSLAVPVTGGLDSTVLYERALCQTDMTVRPYYVDFSHSYSAKERFSMGLLGIRPKLLLEGKLDETKFWKHIIPGRNFLCLSLIAEEIQGGEIWFGSTNGEMPDHGGDKSKSFLFKVNALFAKLPYPVRVLAPLEEETKSDLVRWWLESNLSVERLHMTVSCFGGGAGHCLSCQACLRKWIAYTNNGLILKGDVPIAVGCAEYIEKYRRVMGAALETGSFSKYTEKRCIETMKALDKL